ncbi:MAG: glycosyl transferase group 1 [Betaproteobacteria bacterium]|nr:glycosyl transferase group 1 [Betaproteobacteria bacterium]
MSRRLKRFVRALKILFFGERRIDVAAEYEFLRREPIGSVQAAPVGSRRSINWIIPPFPFGAGGHLNIFRFVQLLEQRGFECRVVVNTGAWFGTPEEVRRKICECFMPIKAMVYLGMNDVPPAYYTIATGWQTAYLAARVQATRCRCYFVQDYEPWFYPMGSDYVLAEETYRMGLVGITDGDWLRAKLASEYGMETHSVGCSFDRRIYFPDDRNITRPRKKIFFYARPATERRAFEMGVLVLAEVKKRIEDVEIVLAGATLDQYSLPFPYTAKGVVHPDLLGALYRDCDLALVLSFTNLSLAPLELMACGVPVISNRGPNTEWLLSDACCCMVRPRIPEVTEALCRLLENDPERIALRAAGLRKAQSTSWDEEADKMASILEMLAQRQLEPGEYGAEHESFSAPGRLA